MRFADTTAGRVGINANQFGEGGGMRHQLRAPDFGARDRDAHTGEEHAIVIMHVITMIMHVITMIMHVITMIMHVITMIMHVTTMIVIKSARRS